MPDINLLKDTKDPEGKRRKLRTPGKIEMTEPLKEGKKEEKYQKPPSSFFKDLFKRKKKDPEDGKDEKELPSFKKAERGTEKIRQEKEVEDIFASIKGPKESSPAVAPKESEMAKGAADPAPIKIELPENEKEQEKTPEFIPAKEEEIRPAVKQVEETEKEPELKKEKGAEKDKKKKKEEKKAKKDKSFLVNLLPEDMASHEAPKKKLINLGFIILGTVLFIAILYFVMILYQSNIVTRAEELKLERVTVGQQIDTQEDLQRESIAFKEKIDSAKDILSTHIYWTKFFTLLEKYTVTDVYFSSALNFTRQSIITLEASAPDFETVAQQLVVFQNANDFVQNVSITSAAEQNLGLAEGIPPGSDLSRQVGFSISLELVPEVFYKTDMEVDSGEENSNLNTNTSVNSNLNLNTNLNTNFNLNTNTPLNSNFNLNTNLNANNNIISNSNLNSNLNTNSALPSNTNLNFYFNLNTNSSLNTNSE